nr:MFS transporter [uncultured Holophaga sp.]
MLTPISLALVREAYEDPRARGRAIAYWAMGGSVAGAAGPVLGGALSQISWRLIFFINAPIGLAAGSTMASFYGVVFLQSLYFQQLRSVSALGTGLLFLLILGSLGLRRA